MDEKRDIIRLGLLGPPGAGKGTQGERLAGCLNIPLISRGVIFRRALQEGSEAGQRAAKFVNKGELVPDEVVWGILQERLQQEDCRIGYILDGFPRTVNQARLLANSSFAVEKVIAINVPDEEVVQRISGRWSCPGCGAAYHEVFLPPPADRKCGHCGDTVVQREDDRPETVRERLRVYWEVTAPLIDFYQKIGILAQIDGEGDAEEVFLRIAQVAGISSDCTRHGR